MFSEFTARGNWKHSHIKPGEDQMKQKDEKKKVLFICTHNSARSQMAEGFLKTLYPDRYEAYSAGTEAAGVNPHAVQVMAEIGIDISSHRSKGVNKFLPCCL
jgi:arsenate reductase